MLYFPILSSIPQFFDRHRGFAMGFILSGNGVGGLILAPLLHLMLERVGIRWTLRALGAWNLVVTVPVACADPTAGIDPADLHPYRWRGLRKMARDLDTTRGHVPLLERPGPPPRDP